MKNLPRRALRSAVQGSFHTSSLKHLNNYTEPSPRYSAVSRGTAQVLERLSRSKLLGLTELRSGLQVQAYSHVGKVRLGDLTITVHPKIKGAPLLNLIRYAYGFRRLNLISESQHTVDDYGIEDLLISQLNAEIQELAARGLMQCYNGTSEYLSSPRGRIDLNRMARHGGRVSATFLASIIHVLKTLF